MSTYTEFTEALADQWVSGLQQLQDVQTAAVAQAVRNASPFLPDAAQSVTDQLADQREFVEANYKLGARLLEAHREYLLSLVKAAVPTAGHVSTTVETTITTEQQ